MAGFKSKFVINCTSLFLGCENVARTYKTINEHRYTKRYNFCLRFRFSFNREYEMGKHPYNGHRHSTALKKWQRQLDTYSSCCFEKFTYSSLSLGVCKWLNHNEPFNLWTTDRTVFNFFVLTLYILLNANHTAAFVYVWIAFVWGIYGYQKKNSACITFCWWMHWDSVNFWLKVVSHIVACNTYRRKCV